MSANVWFEEVDIGLIQELKNTIKHKDKTKNLIRLDDKAFIIRKPEEVFKSETYPCVSIYNLEAKYDPKRLLSSAPIVLSRNEDTGKALVEDPATPFNLTYQIDFWAKYQDDMNIMLREWLKGHHRQFNLSVVDDGGNTRLCNCLIRVQPKKSDLMQNGERLFHTIIIYEIWVELDDETRYNVDMVTGTNIGLAPNTN